MGYFESIFNSPKIDFIIRLPASRKVFKDLMDQSKDMESMSNLTRYNKRTLLIESRAISLYNNQCFAYIILDPHKKSKDLDKLLDTKEAEDECGPTEERRFKKAGVFVTISSKKLDKDSITEARYMLQSVEQVFGFTKHDLGILPLRIHQDQPISGYLFLRLLMLCVFIEIRSKVGHIGAIDRLLMNLRSLKSKVFDECMVIQEVRKSQKEIFEACDIIASTSCGI